MICLTYDSDYIEQGDMVRFLREFPIPGNGTFFLHQKYDIDWGSHELGPHPFLNNSSNWMQTTKSLVSEIGLNKISGIRTHSCFYSQVYCAELAKEGFSYTSLFTHFYQQGQKPIKHPWGNWELPIFYMDNCDFCHKLNWVGDGHRPFSKDIIKLALDSDDLYVFDFHPLHIMLNTRTYQDYNNARNAVVNEKKSPIDLAYSGRGTREFYLELCEAMTSQNIKSVTGSEAISKFNS